MADGAVKVERESEEVSDLGFVLPDKDVRRKRPPALSFLLRLVTLRRIARVIGLLALDYVGVFLAVYTALAVKSAVKSSVDWTLVYHQATDFIPFAYLVTVLLFARSDLYAARSQRPGLQRIVSSLTQVTVVSLIFALVNGDHFQSYYIFYGSLFFGVVYVGTFRWISDTASGKLLELAGYRRRAVLIGTGKHIDAVAHALGEASRSPVDVVGFISLRPRPDNGLRSLGQIGELGVVLDEHSIQEVIIADPDFPQERAVEVVDQCHRRGVQVHVAPSTMEILIHRAEFVPGQSVPLFELKPPVFEGIDFALKRTFDVVVSIGLLIVSSPILLMIAIAVRLSSRGPIIYPSVRPGIGGVPFACFKFRTMREEAEQMQADLESLNEATGPLFKIKRDPRLTPVGAFLRRYSLDELPQLWNVVRGDMSLVGPRPLPLRDFDQLEEWHKKRYLVLPGITGLWQVSGRSELDFDDLVRLDFLYLERWSVFLDLTILLKTVPAVLTRRGAF